MKLVTFHKDSKVRTGVLAEGGIIDLDAAAVAFGLPAAGDMLTILSRPGGMAGVYKIAAAAGSTDGPWRYAPETVELMAPIARPPKILGAALNYYDFCVRGSLAIPNTLKVFSKAGTTVIGPHGCIRLPAGRTVTYEGELAVVMGRYGKNIPLAEAFDYVAGYTVLNDLTANDAVKEDVQLMRAKNFDTFCPMGPALVTKDEIADPYQLAITTTVNGIVRQKSVVGQLIFKIPEIISYFSSFLTLEPGDIIATGTPSGTALQHDPPAFLAPGDVVTVTVDKIGTLTNPCIVDKI